MGRKRIGQPQRVAGLVGLLIALLVPTLMPTLASAEWPTLSDPPSVTRSGTNDVAVIVAIEDYLLLPDVEGAIANANDWEIFFRQGLGVPTVHVLANQDATRESMLKFARMAAADVGPEGRIWWVFIGHGAPALDGRDGLLVGMDAQQTVESLQSRGLGRAELMSALEAKKMPVVAILDACFSGRTGLGEALAAGVQPVVGIEALRGVSQRSVVLSAAKPSEVAGRLPGARRPAFSYLVLGALRGWADDGDGSVTAGEALFFARRELRGVKGRQQTPQLEGDANRVLSDGASEPRPEVVGIADAPTETAGPVDGPTQAAADQSRSERRLRYLQSRITYDGMAFRQGDQVLGAIPFYHAVGRPDLAAEFRTHTPWMWASGGVLLAAGIGLVAWGLSSDGTDDSGRTLGGFLGGFFTVAAGTSLLTIGIMRNQHPVSGGEREVFAREHNKALLEELGLGPEDDPPVERRKGVGDIFGSRSTAPPSQYGVGISLAF